MTRTLHLALTDTLADWEIGYLTAHLRGGGADLELVTISADGGPVTTMGGLRVAADRALGDVAPGDSAMLVLPGAATWQSPAAQPFVAAARAWLTADVPVAAICGATWALAAAGLLDDRRHTSNDGDWLASSGYAGAAHHVADEPVVTDRGVTTAGAVAPVHFAAAVFAAVGAYEPPALASWTRLYADRDPAGYHELAGMGLA